MKSLILFFSFFLTFSLYSQNYPEFSALSSTRYSLDNPIKVSNGFLYSIPKSASSTKIFKINNDAIVVDSLDLFFEDSIYLGVLHQYADRLFFIGSRYLNLNGTNTAEVYDSQSESIVEINEDLDVISRKTYFKLTPFHGPFNSTGGPNFFNNQMQSNHILNDTVYSVNGYFLYEGQNPFTPIGRRLLFQKYNLDGTLYEFTDLQNVANLTSSIFTDKYLYILGQLDFIDIETKTVGQFDLSGNFVKALKYDNYESGSLFGGGSTGCFHDSKFYINYNGLDPTLEGCPEDNLTIDIRNEDFSIVKRFKIPDCGFRASGKNPFGFNDDGTIYFHCVDSEVKKIGIYKLDENYNILWSKFIDFPYICYPISQLSAEGGSFLLNCYAQINNTQVLKIFKISPEGDIISETNLPIPAEKKVFFSPSPFQNELTLTEHLIQENLTASVYDFNGRLMGHFPVTSGRLNLGQLSNGTYVIHLMEGKNKFLGTQVVLKVE